MRVFWVAASMVITLTHVSGPFNASRNGLEAHFGLIRGHKVMFDADLAALYDCLPSASNEQGRRNRERFPEDFMFQLGS